MASFGYKVALSGTGADELFTGYYDHHLLYIAERVLEGDGSTPIQNWEKFVNPFLRNPLLKNSRLYVDDPSFREHIYYKSNE